MGVCNKDEDCSGMEGKQCVDGKCTSGKLILFIVTNDEGVSVAMLSGIPGNIVKYELL
jgi:hypothetical protein